MTLKVLVVFTIPLFLAFAAGDRCVNRKGDISNCTYIHSCKAAFEAVAKAKGAKIYATGDVCGYDTEPLICCQTLSDFALPSNGSDEDENGSKSSVNANVSSDLDIFTNFTELDEVTTAIPLVLNDIDSDLSQSSSLTSSATTQVDVRVLSTVDESSVPPDPSVALNTLTDTSKDRTTPTTLGAATEPSVSRKTTPISVKKLLPDRYTCGIENEKRQLGESQVAAIDEFPWVALLRYRNALGYDAGFRCTGTLINDKYVVTAAHCVVPGPESFHLEGIRLGEWLISSITDCILDYYGEECADKVIDVGVKSKIPHPNYESGCGKNNIALVRMDRAVTYTAFVRPICLPVQNLSPPAAGTVLTTSGWGTSRYGAFLDIKSKVRLSVLNNFECLSRIWGYTRMFSDQVCVGKRNINDICAADPGGPLMAIDEEDKPQWYLEGVTSMGVDCDKDKFVSVYTRVTEYIDWILQVVADVS